MPRPGRLRAVAAGALPALGALLAGCTDSQRPNVAGDNVAELEISGFGGFAQSEASFELWVTFAASPAPIDVSLGRFHVNEFLRIVGTDWQPTSFRFAPDAAAPLDEDGAIDWARATGAFVTLEPRDDDDPAPMLPALLSGPFVNGTAHLDLSGARALGADLSGAGGSFHLATPTTAAPDDERDGIWFAAPGGAAASLDLPALPDGWVYQAWHTLLFAETRSLGTFPAPAGADGDGPGPNAGPLPGYDFPGQDFPWGPGVDLGDGSVLVSIEPADRRDGDGPFPPLVLLGAAVPGAPGTVQTLTPGGTLPTASVTVPFTR